MMPCPDVMAALIVRETKRMKIAIIGNALPLRDHPLRVAEEIAVLDCVSGGRIISGFVRGIGVEYFTFGSDPTRSRERFNEAHDLIIKAWTAEEPFEWISKNYRFRYVNVWPRCIQEPHPPIWVPGFGSPETFDWVAKHRYTFMSVYAPTALQKSWLDGVRAAANRYGYEADPSQLGALFPVHVADTDAEAHAAAEKHIHWLFNKGLKHKLEYLYPPGYMSMGGMKAAMLSGLKPFHEYSYKEPRRAGLHHRRLAGVGARAAAGVAGHAGLRHPGDAAAVRRHAERPGTRVDGAVCSRGHARAEGGVARGTGSGVATS